MQTGAGMRESLIKCIEMTLKGNVNLLYIPIQKYCDVWSCKNKWNGHWVSVGEYNNTDHGKMTFIIIF